MKIKKYNQKYINILIEYQYNENNSIHMKYQIQ